MVSLNEVKGTPAVLHGMAFDVVIRGGRVLDGTGSPWRVADVGIRGGKIAEVGRLGRAKSDRAIDASGTYVAPGFIDIHTHSDIGILVEPTAECAVRQGVTTHLIGNCGDSPGPISGRYRELAVRRFEYYAQAKDWNWSTYAEYLDFMARQGVGINIAGLVGHGSVRLATMGFEERPPTPDEMRSMKDHVDEAMRAGAFGMSTGLVYPPGCFAATDEIVELAKVVARHRGFYASHIRGERETIVDAVRECIDIGERAGCPVQIRHNNPRYGGIGKSSEIQRLWEAARQRGVVVFADNDADTDLGPRLGHALPQWRRKIPTDDVSALFGDRARCQASTERVRADRRVPPLHVRRVPWDPGAAGCEREGAEPRRRHPQDDRNARGTPRSPRSRADPSGLCRGPRCLRLGPRSRSRDEPVAPRVSI